MQYLIKNLVAPLSRRVGTFVGGAIMALGATAEQANTVEMAILIVVTLSADLILSKMDRK